MSIKIGQASLGETGGRNQQPGNQNGRELNISNWYNGRWLGVLRYKSRKKAERAARRPSRRGVSRNGVLAEKFHILTSTGALNLQLFDCKYEDVRKAAVLQTLEAIFSKH